MTRWSSVPALAVGLIFAIARVGLGIAGDLQQMRGEPGSDCTPQRAAVAYYGGAVPAKERPAYALIPCVERTGYATGEPSIAVSNGGVILLNPAVAADGAVGIARSEDSGKTWQFVAHAANAASVTEAEDQNIWVDRKTGRAFWINMEGNRRPPSVPRLDFSDNGGRTWVAGGQPCQVAGIDNCGHPEVFTGPPVRAMEHLQRGFAEVVYVCGGHPLGCQKSVSGGNTWGPKVTIPLPEAASSCGFAFGLNGVVDRRGTVFVPFAPCQQPYVAISHDEGATWSTVRIADTHAIGAGEVPLAIDEGGNLYAAWTGRDRKLYLSISRDHGAHWGAALMIAAPGVGETAIPEVVAGVTGHLAVAYYGSTNPPGQPYPKLCRNGMEGVAPNVGQVYSLACPSYANEKWNLYVTETFDALNSEPLFLSATLNDLARPVWRGCSPASIPPETALGSLGIDCVANDSRFNPLTYGGRLDYFGATLAPDGTVWVGFAQECANGRAIPGNPYCPRTLTGNPDDSLFGLVGHLITR